MSAQNQKTSPLLYMVGLLVAVAIGVGGWFVAPAIIDFLRANVAGLGSVPFQQLRLIVTVAVFVIGLIIAALVVALVTPKDKRTAAEGDLSRERQAMIEQQRAARRRARQRK